MKKTAQKISFIMMVVFFLTGIAMTIVAAVTVGADFGNFVFPVILCGLAGTCSVTAVWWAVLEHFSNVEKALDLIRRNNAEEDELPDSEYSYLPAFLEDLLKQPDIPKLPQTSAQPYPHPTYQPAPQEQPVTQAQPVMQEPPVQPIPQEQPIPDVQSVLEELPIMQEQPTPDEQSVLEEPPIMQEQPVLEEQPVLQEQPFLEEQPVLPEQPARDPDGWFCIHCGAANRADSNFCSTCGQKRN